MNTTLWVEFKIKLVITNRFRKSTTYSMTVILNHTRELKTKNELYDAHTLTVLRLKFSWQYTYRDRV